MSHIKQSTASPSKDKVNTLEKNTATRHRQAFFRIQSCFYWASILLSLAAAGFSFWSWLAIQTDKKMISLQQQVLTNHLASESEKTLKQNQEMQHAYQRQLKKIKALEEALQALNHETYSLRWQALDVAYLLRSAQVQLQHRYDIVGAKALLNTALELLADTQERDWIIIKQAIESDLNTLNQIQEQGPARLWSQLNDFNLKVSVLPRILLIEEDRLPPVLDNHQEGLKGSLWEKIQHIFWSGWSFFKNQFQFKQHADHQFLALISTHHETELRQTIRLLLIQAQQAVLLSDQWVFSASLEQVTQLMNLYFYPSDEKDKLLDELKDLSSQKLNHETPHIMQGLEALMKSKVGTPFLMNVQKTVPLELQSNMTMPDAHQAIDNTSMEKVAEP